MTYQDDVRDFHIAGGQVVNDKPIVPSQELLDLRFKLISEEVTELYTELIGPSESVELDKILSEAVDLVYVIMGLCVSLGLPFHDAWEAIHEANMEKFRDGVKYRKDGKVIKPEGWKPADIKGIIEEAKDGTD